MAIQHSYGGIINEDISDLIANISPSDTPMLSAASTSTATSTKHEWVEDTLASPDSTNAAEEGVDAVTAAVGVGTRLDNRTQISQKAYGVSGTFESVNSVGFDSAIAYASAKAARELKTDVDAVICKGDQAKVTAAGSTAPKTASLNCWVRNADRNTGAATTAGADPATFDGAATDTKADPVRVFTQTMLDDTIEKCWDNGGRPSLIVTGPTNRTVFSTFDGLGTSGSSGVGRLDRAARTIVATADVYMSNFGELSIVSSRHIRQISTKDRDAWLIDPEHLSVAYLRPWQESDLAKTGDSLNRQMIVEYALAVTNTYAHGLVADLGL